MSETMPSAPHSEYSRVRTDELIQVHRSRWELEKQIAQLQVQLREQAAEARRLIEQASETEYRERELLKVIAVAIDECDDAIRIDAERVRSSSDRSGRPADRWMRRFARIRTGLAGGLAAEGVEFRFPSGAPQLDMDAVHSVVATDAVPHGEIVDVLRPGVLWHGKPLRLALVVVADPPLK